MHHNDIYDSVKTIIAKMFLADQISGFFNFDISKTNESIKFIFCMHVHIY